MAETSRTEHMIACLKDLQVSSPDIEASAVVSVDGLTMASSLPADVEEDRVSAMSAAMLSVVLTFVVAPERHHQTLRWNLRGQGQNVNTA
jgi:hypothetical protein